MFSRTLAAQPGVTVASADAATVVAELRLERGRDIWLFGGARLFTSLLDAGVVDRVEVAIVPVLLGAGIPLVGSEVSRTRLGQGSRRPGAQIAVPKPGGQMGEAAQRLTERLNARVTKPERGNPQRPDLERLL